MINVNFVKSTKVKVVSVMLSFVLLFLGIPALRLKAASDSEHIHDSTLARDTISLLPVAFIHIIL